MVLETIVLVGDDDEQLVRERLAFSNGLARSAKLAVLENQLEQYLERHRTLPHLMKARTYPPSKRGQARRLTGDRLLWNGQRRARAQSGQKIPLSRQDVLKQIGELLYFRGKLNLHSEVRRRASGALVLHVRTERCPPRAGGGADVASCWRRPTFTGQKLCWRSCTT